MKLLNHMVVLLPVSLINASMLHLGFALIRTRISIRTHAKIVSNPAVSYMTIFTDNVLKINVLTTNHKHVIGA